jgi:imidazolonepropionase-like amidohydrolase
VPREVQVPEVATPDEAAERARQFLAMGHDGIKLFTGSFMGDKPVVNMDTTVAKAAVDIAHAQGKPVFAHPQNKAGVETVIAAGVDILAHTVPSQPDGYTSEQLARFKSQGIALIPTLSLFTTIVLDPAVTARVVAATVNQLRQFSENGGVVLFGTDVGFTKLYDTTLEYELLHRALSERQVLATLTTNPAQYFKAAKKGRVEKGFDGDVVVLDGDPMAEIRNLARVAYTIRAGQIIYQKP